MNGGGVCRARCKVCTCVFLWHSNNWPFADVELVGTCESCVSKVAHECVNECEVVENKVADCCSEPCGFCRGVYPESPCCKCILEKMAAERAKLAEVGVK